VILRHLRLIVVAIRLYLTAKIEYGIEASDSKSAIALSISSSLTILSRVEVGVVVVLTK
jgi:hypothetical protein